MGKAKRNNSYDSAVAERRKVVQSYGAQRQRLSINSSFRGMPLEPPIATVLSTDTGTGTGTFCTASLAADQTTNIAATDHVEFDTLDEDGGITLQTGAGQADGIFELSAGKKYFLSSLLRPEFSGATGQLVIAWYDITNGAEIGKRAIYESQTHVSDNANQPAVEAIVTPTTNITVEVRIIAVTALTALANEYCVANIFEIALGGSSGAGGSGGGGASFPLEYSIDDQGNQGGVTVTHDLSASTAHLLKFTATGDVTIAFSNFPTTGTGLDWYVEVTQDGTGGHAITWPAEVTPDPNLSTTASTVGLVALHTDDGGTIVRSIALTDAAPLTTGANTALSNLSGVAINTSLISDSNNTDDLGSSGIKWKNLFLAGTATIATATITNATITTLAATTLSGDITMGDNDVLGIGNIIFGTSGSLTPGSPTIWADATGDMIINVASGDSIFFTENDVVIGQFKLDSFEVRTVTEDGPDLVLNNNDQTPTDNDTVAQIIFRGNDDALADVNYGLIEFDMNDVSAASKQATFKISCQSDNALAPVIQYTGSTGVFLFGAGVDAVRPSSGGDVDLGSATNEWNAVYSEAFIVKDGGALASANSIITDSNGMVYQTEDTRHNFRIAGNNTGIAIEEDRLQFQRVGSAHRIDAQTSSIQILAENESDTIEFFNGTSRTNATMSVEDTQTIFRTETDDLTAYDLEIIQNNNTPADSRTLGNIRFMAEDSGGTDTTYGRITGTSLDVTNGTEDGILQLAVITGGSIRNGIEVRGSSSNGVNDALLGFFGETPVAQQQLDADPTNAEISTALLNLGLTKL